MCYIWVFCDSWCFQSIVVLPFQVEKPKTLVLCTIAENKQLFLDIITDKKARNTRMLRKIFIWTVVKFFLVLYSDVIFSRLVPSQSSSTKMFYGISYPCLQIRASWRESKCSSDSPRWADSTTVWILVGGGCIDAGSCISESISCIFSMARLGAWSNVHKDNNCLNFYGPWLVAQKSNRAIVFRWT